MKQIGSIFRKDVKPSLHEISDPKKYHSVLVGSALLKTMGDIIGQDKKGSGLNLAGGSIITPTITLFQKNLKALKKPISGGNMNQENPKKQVAITAKDILGPKWKEIGKKINDQMNTLYNEKSGGALLKKLHLDKFGPKVQNAMKKAKNKLSDFWHGKTALKPSHVIGLTGLALGAAAAVATAQPELLPLSAPALSAMGLTSKLAGFTSAGFSLFGRGLNIPDPVKKFIKKNPKIVMKIKKLIDKKTGAGLGNRTKNILKLAGAAGIVGALSFLNWYSNASNNGDSPIRLMDLELSINDDIPDVLEHSYETVPEHFTFGKGYGKMSCGKGCSCNSCQGSGVVSDLVNWAKHNKSKALAILLGTAAIGTAMALGEKEFRAKFNGLSLTKSEGRSLLKRIIMNGDVVRMTAAELTSKYAKKGEGISPKVKKILKMAGVAAVPAAIAIASYALGNKRHVDDDFGDIGAEEHYEMFGDGRKVPRRIKRLIQDNKYISGKIYQAIKKMGRGKKLGQCQNKRCVASEEPEQKEMPQEIPKIKPAKQDGNGNKNGCGKQKRIGNKKEVWEGGALKTAGGLTKENLMQNKRGKIVSIKQHQKGLGVAQNLKPIQKK